MCVCVWGGGGGGFFILSRMTKNNARKTRSGKDRRTFACVRAVRPNPRTPPAYGLALINCVYKVMCDCM